MSWDSHRMQIEPFHKIRKHVRRSCRSIGTAQDSPVNPDEHVMIMFYDILLLDDIVCATEPHDKRCHRLCSVVQCIPGRAEISTGVKIRLIPKGSELACGFVMDHRASCTSPRSPTFKGVSDCVVGGNFGLGGGVTSIPQLTDITV
jgi:hypothetical protein